MKEMMVSGDEHDEQRSRVVKFRDKVGRGTAESEARPGANR
jgi:hypothetical protein